jgi:carbohydrate esterase-like sialic acid-specific acetylesterase
MRSDGNGLSRRGVVKGLSAWLLHSCTLAPAFGNGLDGLRRRTVHEAAATSSNSIRRVLLIGYGQSNMGTFFGSVSGSPPTPNANVSYYNSHIAKGPIGVWHPLTPGEIGDGIITCMNQINNATGLSVISLTGAVGGTGISGLTPGDPSNAFTILFAQVNAVVQPTDYIAMLWDQGEGDADSAPPEQPQFYIDNLTLIRNGLASSLGVPTAPLLVAGLGAMWGTVADGFTGQPSGGNSPYCWQRIRNAHFFASVQIPHVYYSHTNIDIIRSNATDYHYVAPSTQGMGQRFAQGVTTLMGKTSGFAHWEIANAATVDATHTNVNLTQTLGTDFTPTSSADGWEVSGDNGATWTAGTGTRVSSTQLQLTHRSLSTSSARLVRYQWGYNQAGNSAGPTPGYLRDNSAFTVPLTPTTWDIRPTALSTVPCATWRNITTSSRSPNPLSQNTETVLCFPGTDNYQKFLILAIYSGSYAGLTITVTVTPNVGSPVVATFVGTHPTTNYGLSLFQAQLGSDANAATYLTFNVSSASDTFTVFTIHVFDVPLTALGSTTNTGTNSTTTTLTANTTPPLTSNCTVNASAGGLMIAMNAISISQTTRGAFATYSSNFNNRWEDGTTITLDAANSSANASSPFSVSFGTTDPSNPINMYTFMASWR